MAVETKDFGREDLYTLLVATRILNFLKGIPVRSPRISLDKVLKTASEQDNRSSTGAQILRLLLKEKILCASTAKGLEPLPKFKARLFFQLWRKLDTIRTQEDKIIQTRRG
jgi:hypothetical protein